MFRKNMSNWRIVYCEGPGFAFMHGTHDEADKELFEMRNFKRPTWRTIQEGK